MILPFELVSIKSARANEYEVDIKVQTVTEYVQTENADERFTFPNTITYALNYTVDAIDEDDALKKVAEIVQRGI